jgi:pimeloyl-ACP methyl ester carboxylesterase
VPEAQGERPAALLLHGITSSRDEWTLLIPHLLERGYNVLTVDQRAHGETGGDRDLVAAIGDVQAWFDWLREQPPVDDDKLVTIGSSWGTPPALAGCAADTGCVTAIAMGPGDFPLLDESMFEQMTDRSVLFIVGRGDNVLYDTQKLFDRTAGEAAMYIYNTGAHASGLFGARSRYRDSVIDLILNWLDDQTTRPAD